MIKDLVTRFRGWAGFPIMSMTLLLVAINAVYSPNFLSRSVLEGFLSTYAPLALCALAQSIVLIGGGIDLSITGVISLVNVTTIVLVGAGWDFLEVGPAGGLYVCRSMGA